MMEVEQVEAQASCCSPRDASFSRLCPKPSGILRRVWGEMEKEYHSVQSPCVVHIARIRPQPLVKQWEKKKKSKESTC
jgi:hypothetical protein